MRAHARLLAPHATQDPPAPMPPVYPATVSTERLHLAPVDVARDLDAFAEIFVQKAVTDFLFPAHLGGARTREQTEAWLRHDQLHWECFNWGMWSLFLDEGAPAIGLAGLAYTVVAGKAEVELGWVLDERHWGQGYAQEASKVALAHAGQIRGLQSVAAFTMVENARAIKSIEALGFTREPDTVVVELPHRLYRIAV
jgi:[ribosomal protein S5]-alanine N-acetyltransferase